MELALTKRNSVWSVVQIFRLIPSFLFLFPAPFKMKFCEVLNTQGLFTCLCWASEFRDCGRCQMGSGRDRRSLCPPPSSSSVFPKLCCPVPQTWPTGKRLILTPFPSLFNGWILMSWKFFLVLSMEFRCCSSSTVLWDKHPCSPEKVQQGLHCLGC